MATITKESTSGTIKPVSAVGRPSKPNIIPQKPQNFNSDTRTNPNQSVGWSGIKFPFRFTSTGRVGVSATSITDASHIKESIEQILQTSYRERVLLPLFGSPLKDMVFEDIQEITNIFQAQIINALQKWEKRITIKYTQVTIDYYGNSVNILISYYINSIQPSVSVIQTVSIKNKGT